MSAMKPPPYEIKELPATFVLAKRFTAKPIEVGDRLGEALPACFGRAIGEKLSPGRPFARYRNMTADAFEIDAGVIVDKEPKPQGDFIGGRLPKCRAAVAIHYGPYETLGDTHEALSKWAKTEGHTPAPGPWEIYITDPTEEPDSSRWETRIYLPLR